MSNPRSYLEMAIALTPTRSAKARWLKPAMRRAAFIRSPIMGHLLGLHCNKFLHECKPKCVEARIGMAAQQCLAYAAGVGRASKPVLPQ